MSSLSAVEIPSLVLIRISLRKPPDGEKFVIMVYCEVKPGENLHKMFRYNSKVKTVGFHHETKTMKAVERLNLLTHTRTLLKFQQGC